jgi:polysaccharide export outer membrane protein
MLANGTRYALMLAAALASPLAAAAQAQSATELPGPPVATATASSATYKLDSGDKLRITVFGEDNLTGEYAVSSTGVISFPLIGDIPAVGRTLADVQAAIRTRLAAGYINDPRIAIEVLEYRTFYILGEVNKPGEYPYRSNMTVEQAVATAGGYTYRANRKRFEIAHSDGRADERTTFKAAGQLKVAPGDTIHILERFF